MPMYHIHIEHDFRTIDEHGTDLPDKAAAWKEATETAAPILRDIDGKFQPGQDLRVVVEDELRDPLYELTIHAKARH